MRGGGDDEPGVNRENNLRVAEPVEATKSGSWASWMQSLFSSKPKPPTEGTATTTSETPTEGTPTPVTPLQKQPV